MNTFRRSRTKLLCRGSCAEGCLLTRKQQEWWLDELETLFVSVVQSRTVMVTQPDQCYGCAALFLKEHTLADQLLHPRYAYCILISMCLYRDCDSSLAFFPVATI